MKQLSLNQFLELLASLDRVQPGDWPVTSEQWLRVHETLVIVNKLPEVVSRFRGGLRCALLQSVRDADGWQRRLELRLRVIEAAGRASWILDNAALLGEGALRRLLELMERVPFVTVRLEDRVRLSTQGKRVLQSMIGSNRAQRKIVLLPSEVQVREWGQRARNCLGREEFLTRYRACCPVIFGISREGAPVLTVALSLRSEARFRINGFRVLQWQWTGEPDAEACALAVDWLARFQRVFAGHRRLHFESPVTFRGRDAHPLSPLRAMAAELDSRLLELQHKIALAIKANGRQPQNRWTTDRANE